ncbi:Hypothetical_protein [Hexamita inflata]|uniref:Hypothetical_protein n=1 Tax=Hexamita inflata TaxID=28002 RepID=A0AA86NC10_9EUKA|nr:Hypothetical protein HINF_LOCUS4088 [Hexamita inflata]
MTHLTVTLSSVLRLNLIIPSSSRKSWQSTNPNLVTQQRYLKLISISYLIFQDCHSEQPPQTTQVSSALEQTLQASEVIFVTVFGMAGMNLGTSVSVATRSASKFRDITYIMCSNFRAKSSQLKAVIKKTSQVRKNSQRFFEDGGECQTRFGEKKNYIHMNHGFQDEIREKYFIQILEDEV